MVELAPRRYVGKRATLRGADFTLRAGELILDAASEMACATGEVVLARGSTAATARELRYSLAERRLSLADGVLYLKRGVDPGALAAADTPRRVRLAGANAFTFTAGSLRQTGPGLYQAQDVSFTPCDCLEGAPTWRVEASGAELAPGDSAILDSPVLYLWKVPVFWLPALYVPLAPRKTGLLFPNVTRSGQNGWGVEQPFFLTLGRSADSTLSAGWFSGIGGRGVRGPQAALELRLAPAQGTRSELWLSELYDLNRPGGGTHRPQLAFSHAQRPGAAELYADARLVSDARLLAQLVPETLGRRDYLASQGRAELRGARWLAGVSGAYYQDLRAGSAGSPVALPLFGARAAPQVHQAPALAGSWVGGPLLGPLSLSVRGVLEYFPLSRGQSDDAGLDGLTALSLGWPGPDAGEGDGRLSPGERTHLFHAALQPVFSAPLNLGGALLLVPEAAGRIDADAFPADPARNRLRPAGYLGARLSTALVRAAGDLSHRIEPSLAWRLAPGLGPSTGLRTLAAQPYSEAERLFAGSRLHQAALMIETRLDQPVGSSTSLGIGRTGVRPLLRAVVGQGVDFSSAPARASEAFGTIAFGAGPASLSAEGRYDWTLNIVASARARLGLADTRGDSLAVDYTYTPSGTGDRIRAGLWELFGAGTQSGGARVQSLTISTSIALAPVTLGAAAAFAFGEGLGARPVYSATLTYTSPCNCLRTSVTGVSAADPQTGLRRFPEIRPTFDWESLGGGSSFQSWGSPR